MWGVGDAAYTWVISDTPQQAHRVGTPFKEAAVLVKLPPTKVILAPRIEQAAPPGLAVALCLCALHPVGMFKEGVSSFLVSTGSQASPAQVRGDANQDIQKEGCWSLLGLLGCLNLRKHSNICESREPCRRPPCSASCSTRDWAGPSGVGFTLSSGGIHPPV